MPGGVGGGFREESPYPILPQGGHLVSNGFVADKAERKACNIRGGKKAWYRCLVPASWWLEKLLNPFGVEDMRAIFRLERPFCSRPADCFELSGEFRFIRYSGLELRHLFKKAPRRQPGDRRIWKIS